jgi:hypothetical protein
MIGRTDVRATPRVELGRAFMEYVADQNRFVGLKVFPLIPSEKQSGVFPAITRESTTRVVTTKRAAGSKYSRDGFDTKDIPFACEEHGLEGPLDDSQRNLYKTDFDAEFVTVKTVGDKLLMSQEVRIAAAAFSTTTFTGASLYTDVSAAPWTAAASDVIGQVRAAREKVRQNTGVEPNAVVMSKSNLDYLLENTAIKAAIGSTKDKTEAVIKGMLSAILGVQKVIVGMAIYNSAKEGKAFVGAEVWSPTYSLIAYIPEDNDLLAPAVGRTVLWTGDSPENQTVESYREENVRSEVFRVRQHVDEVAVDAYFGHLLKVR